MFLYGSFCGCNGGEEMGEGGKKAQGFGLLCGRGGSRHANILPLPLLLVFTAPRGIFKEGRGGVSAEWKGGISGLVVARGNHAKKSRFGWGMLYPIWRDRRRIGRQQKEKPFVPKRSEEKGLIRFAMWQTLLMIIS